MTLLNRTQFAVLLFSYINTTIEHASLPEHQEGLETLVDEGYTDYLNSPEHLRDNFNLNDLAGITETCQWSECCSKGMDVYFHSITMEEALDLQRQLNWMGMEIDLSTRRVTKATGVV